MIPMLRAGALVLVCAPALACESRSTEQPREVTMTTNPNKAMNRAMDEAQVRQRIDSLAKAVRAKDLAAVMAMYAPDIVSFDIEPPLQYVHAKHWDQTFAAYQGPMGYEVRDLSVTTGGDVAFSHSLNHVSGTLKNGRHNDFWLRWTACFRKINGTWLITHDHVSVPADFESGKALLDLKP